MTSRRVVLRNASWNWAGLVVVMAAGFVTAPFLVRRLGGSGYGLWILVASFSSYFGLLDLGVRGAVGRQVAFHRARGDRDGINGVFTTSLAFLSAAGVVAALGTFAVSLALTRWFDVPPEQAGPARVALCLVGLNLALWLPLNVFDATLWAFQRFDLINAVDVTAVVLRTALTFLWIGRGGGLVELALLNLLSQSGAQAAKGFLSFRIDPGLRASASSVTRGYAREVFGYGAWYALLSASRTLTGQVSPMVIGFRLGLAAVTPFSVAGRLVGYAGGLVTSVTGVLTPVATALHAEGGHDRQRWLFTEGGKFCASLSLYFTGMFLILGRPLTVLWMGPDLAWSSTLLAILAVGEALPLSQWVTHGIVLGMGRHRALALAGLAECAAAAGLAWFLAGRWGLVGVCAAFAASGAVARGLFPLVYGCRLLGHPVGLYLARVAAPAAAAAVAPWLALAAATAWREPASPLDVVGYLSAYTLAYASAAALALVGPGRLRSAGSVFARRLAGPRDV